MNKLPPANKPFWQSRIFYTITVAIVVVLIVTVVFFDHKSFKNFAWAYAQKNVFVTAVNTASKNKRVNELMGNLKPINDFTIAEGEVVFIKNNGFTATVTIKGHKAKGKMDLKVHKEKNSWHYDYITIRTGAPQQTIKIMPPEPVTVNPIAQ